MDSWFYQRDKYLELMRWIPGTAEGPRRVGKVVDMMSRTDWLPKRISWQWDDDLVSCHEVEFFRPVPRP